VVAAAVPPGLDDRLRGKNLGAGVLVQDSMREAVLAVSPTMLNTKWPPPPHGLCRNACFQPDPQRSLQHGVALLELADGLGGAQRGEHGFSSDVDIGLSAVQGT